LHPQFFLTPPHAPHTYPLSLHDALPISSRAVNRSRASGSFSRTSMRTPSSDCAPVTLWSLDAESRVSVRLGNVTVNVEPSPFPRSEEHTSELQSRFDLVCRLLLEKKKKK